MVSKHEFTAQFPLCAAFMWLAQFIHIKFFTGIHDNKCNQSCEAVSFCKRSILGFCHDCPVQVDQPIFVLLATTGLTSQHLTLME